MSKPAARSAHATQPAGAGLFTSLLSHCIECGCNDMNACFDEEAGDACHWLELDRPAGKGVCSACPSAVKRWRRGKRDFAVPVDRDVA